MASKESVIIKLFAMLVASELFGCCSNRNNDPTTNASLLLNPEQIVSLSENGQRGDGDAAFRLFEYYQFYVFNQVAAVKWLSIAATNRNASAEYNLGLFYSEKPNRSSVDVENAKYWFGRSAAEGVTNAVEKLREF